MLKRTCFLSITALSIFYSGAFAVSNDTVGAVLHRKINTLHIGHIKVPDTAASKYFGYLEGPSIDNQYCNYRTYVDTANRNAGDCIVKFQYMPILEYFDDTALNEHNAGNPFRDEFNGGPGGTGCLGLGAFRLVDSTGAWLNPMMRHNLDSNLDSLVITILDSSMATPKFTIGYWGWRVGTGGSKINVTWTWSAIRYQRPAFCTVTIQGAFNGKALAGFTNHGTLASGGDGNSTVTIVTDSTEALLASIGKQCGPGETFVDTMVLAIYAVPGYCAGFAHYEYNNAMLLKFDANHTVRYAVAYNAATEPTILYRNPDWRYTMFGLTPPAGALPQDRRPGQGAVHSPANSGPAEYFTLSGRRVTAPLSGVMGREKEPRCISSGRRMERLSGRRSCQDNKL